MSTARLDFGNLSDFLANLAENSQDVYWLSSADFSEIVYISPAFEQIWGRPAKDLYQNPEQWITYLHPEDAKNYHPILHMKEKVERLGKDARYEEDYRIIRPDGDIRWIIDRGFPVMDSQTGKCVGVTGVAIDVTRERKIQEALEKAQQDKLAAHELKMKFIRDMQHDIRTPFTGLWGLAHQLADIETDPEKLQMIQLIEGGAKQLLDYCNTVLDFNKINDSPIMEEKLDLQTLLDGIIAMEKPPAYHKNLDLILETVDIPKFIFADDTRIKSLLINLMSNAIKFTNEGYVKLIVKKAKELNEHKILLQFIVEDTGIGIPLEKQKYIYEKYYRVEPANTGKYNGSGLGLSIVKSIVNDLDGEIEVISELNKGTTFIVSLPLRIPFIS